MIWYPLSFVKHRWAFYFLNVFYSRTLISLSSNYFSGAAENCSDEGCAERDGNSRLPWCHGVAGGGMSLSALLCHLAVLASAVLQLLSGPWSLEHTSYGTKPHILVGKAFATPSLLSATSVHSCTGAINSHYVEIWWTPLVDSVLVGSGMPHCYFSSKDFLRISA